MKSAKVSYRYADTLLKMAKSTEALKHTLEVILMTMKKTKLLDWLLAPQISKSVKDKAVQTIFKDVEPWLVNFLRYLVKNNRMNYFPEIVAAYDRLAEEDSDALEVRVVSSVPLTEEEKAKILNRFSKEYGKQAVLEEKIDPSIIGGLIIFIGSKMIDGSTRQRLVHLKDKLNEKPYAAKS